MSMCHTHIHNAAYAVLLVLAVNSDQFQTLQIYMLLLRPPVLCATSKGKDREHELKATHEVTITLA